MTISKERLQEFIAIYKKHFWTDISEKEALDLAIPLLILTQHVLLPNVEILWKK